MIEFANPSAFLLLLLIPILYFLRYLKLLSRLSLPLTLSNWNGENYKWKSRGRSLVSFISRLCAVLSYVFMVMALASPVTHEQQKIYSTKGSAIVFVVDVSPSMSARDIGDLRTLAVDSAAGSMSVAGKRLQRLKLGDPDASTVTSTLTGLTIGACPSLTEIDARNVVGLTETIDLTNCPRIKSAYFGGTDVKSVIVPSGAKIANLQLSDATTTISLVDLPKLSSEGLTYGELSNVEYLRIEDCPNLDAFGILKELYYNQYLSVVELLSENITTSPCTIGADGK